MITFNVSDEIGTAPRTPALEWSWTGLQSCTARLLIEERIRVEFERVAQNVPASDFFAELSGGLDGYVDKIIEKALAAFSAGKLLLIVNDKQVSSLDEMIPIQESNNAVFLRIVPLRGG